MTPDKRVYDSILDCVGNTPLVRLNRITKDLKCTVYAKVEFFNPAGSIKDRVAKQIIEDYEAEGKIKKGGMILGDDYGWPNSKYQKVGVTKAVNEFRKKHNLTTFMQFGQTQFMLRID